MLYEFRNSNDAKHCLLQFLLNCKFCAILWWTECNLPTHFINRPPIVNFHSQTITWNKLFTQKESRPLNLKSFKWHITNEFDLRLFHLNPKGIFYPVLVSLYNNQYMQFNKRIGEAYKSIILQNYFSFDEYKYSLKCNNMGTTLLDNGFSPEAIFSYSLET